MAGTAVAQQVVPPLIPDERRAFNRAIRLERLKQFQAAEEIYRALLERNPRNSRAYLQLKTLYRKLERHSELERLILNRLKVLPHDLQSHAELGELYFDRGENEKASEYWEDILVRNPRSQVAYRVLMQTFLRHQLYEKLDDLILRGRKAFNDPSLFSSDLGLIYRRNHNWEKSVHEYVTFAVYHPKQIQTVSSQLLRMSDDEESIPIIEAKLVERIPESEDVVRNLYCDFLFKMGRYGDAFDQHLALGTERDRDLDRWLRFANNLRKESQLSLALNAFSTVLRNIPQGAHHRKLTGQALYGLALTYESQILPTETVPSLGEYFPNNFFFESDFPGVHTIHAQPLEETFTLYDSILVSLPSSTFSPQAHYRLGEIKYRITEDYDGALESFRSAYAMSKDADLKRSASFRIGDVLMAKGQFPEALDYVHGQLKATGSPVEKNRYLLKKCQVLFLSGELDSTLFHLNRLISLLDITDDQLNDALELRGFIEENYVRPGETARQAFQTYLAGERLLRQSKVAEAQNVFKEIEELYRDAPISDEAIYRHAEIDLLLGNHESAVSTFAFLKGSPLGDRATVMIGEIYERYLEDKEEAIRWYYAVLEEHPGSMLAEPVRYRIREIEKAALD